MFSIKEYQSRLLANLKDQKILQEIHAYLDYRIDVRSTEAMQLIMNSFDSVGFGRTHSKVIVLINNEYSLTICGSQNLTANTRDDAGIITCDINTALFRKNFIINKIQSNA
jgi:hypothetical protein